MKTRCTNLVDQSLLLQTVASFFAA